MGQSEAFHETWAYLRDNAKPLKPDDVYDLRAVREFTPPSKAHVKRIERPRPNVTTFHPKPASGRGERQREIALAQSFARRNGLLKT